MSEDQPRDPRTGKWVEQVSDEGKTILRHKVTDEEYNAEGSFEFPVRARSYDQHVSFWLNVPIPDESVRRFLAVYRYDFDTSYEPSDWAKEEIKKWDKEHPITPKNFPGGKAVGEAARKTELDRLVKINPIRPYDIPATDARMILRLGMMHYWADPLPREDQEKINNLEVAIGDGNKWSGIANVDKKYHLTRTIMRFYGKFGPVPGVVYGWTGDKWE
ncbi:hypothetical protein [Changpingibacter yushuensis]|uniref:hypothetical protein n=1 Tax=Changpingibacter yushuensis TaxID=2758440 RepID=UPI0015F75DAF|nr:hypothetical protein [Changpingibacter yushuensis]